MRVLVLEDEAPARARLIGSLRRCAPDAEVCAEIASVRHGIEWFRSSSQPDLVLADIELADGPSLALFETVPIACPVVFCTAYDAYLTEAMRHNGIDYLLKPIEDDELAAAVAKYRRLEAHFAGRLAALSSELASGRRRYRSRVLARRGAAFVSIATDDIAYVVTEHRLVVIVDRRGDSFSVDRTLSELERELDPDSFFRISRSAIVHHRAVASFRPHTKGRLELAVEPAGPALIVSRDSARAFRDWMDR